MFLKLNDIERAMPRKPTTGKPRSKRLPTSRRLLTWLDRAISDADREALSTGLRELGFGSFDKSVVSKIGKGLRGLTADEMYALGALTETALPNPLTAYEMDAMRKDVMRAAGRVNLEASVESAVGDFPAATKEWLKQPNVVSTVQVQSESISEEESVSENASDSRANESATMLAAMEEGELEMDANAERQMKILVCNMLVILGVEKEVAQVLYEALQLRARKLPISSESQTAGDNSREVVLALMTALGLQQPK